MYKKMFFILSLLILNSFLMACGSNLSKEDAYGIIKKNENFPRPLIKKVSVVEKIRATDQLLYIISKGINDFELIEPDKWDNNDCTSINIEGNLKSFFKSLCKNDKTKQYQAELLLGTVDLKEIREILIDSQTNEAEVTAVLSCEHNPIPYLEIEMPGVNNNPKPGFKEWVISGHDTAPWIEDKCVIDEPIEVKYIFKKWDKGWRLQKT